MAILILTPVHERVLARCVEQDGCLVFTGAPNAKGYGSVRRGRRAEGTALAHVVVWEAEHGPVPDGMEVDHNCRVRLCVRHLELVTPAENKRRQRREWCSKGLHRMEGDNVLHPEGKRRCRACKSDSNKRLYAATRGR